MNPWLHRWRRWCMPKLLGHMADLHPDFSLVLPASSRLGAVCWRGVEVGVLKPLARLKGIGRGRGCFVVASGPSLATVNVGALAGNASFAVNGAIARYDANTPGPNYYVITDPDFVEHRFPLVEAAFAARPYLLLSAAAMSAICERSPSLFRKADVSLIETHFCRYGQPRLKEPQIEALVAAHKTLHASSARIGFSCDAELGLFSAHTVAYYPIQIACYMGFSEVYLLGVDLGGSGNQIRFYERVGSARPSRLGHDLEKYILPSFSVLKRVTEAHPGFRVYNLSASSRLPAELVPRLTLDAALSRAAALCDTRVS